MASPHIEPRPLTLPLIPPASPFAVSSGQSSARSPTTTVSMSPPNNSTTPPTPNPQPQPHIRSMLDVGTDITPKKTNTPQQPSRPALPIPSNIVATSSNDVISSDVPPTPPPKDIPTPQSNITPKTRPRSKSKPSLRPAAAMTIDTSKSIPQPTPPEKPPPTQRKLSVKNNTPNSTKSNGTNVASPPSPTKEQKPKLARIRSFLKLSNSNAKNEIAPMTQADAAAESHSLNSKETTSTQSTTVFTFSSRSSATSPSATPPSPGSPASTINEAASEPGMLEEENPLTKRHTHSQSYSNLAPQGPRMGITWGPGVATDRPKTPRRRSISTEHIRSVKKPGPMTGIKEEHDPRVILVPAFSQDAGAGAGVKARRLSTCLPDEFWVDYCELDKEFKSASAVPLRRGKVVGKGATSTVRLMCRKGDPKGVFYAVKEFRARDSKHKETEEDYVKKVKSEYSIAKSLHHPNIVETVRLCTSHGHWCHIMEYCGNGELYGMVERGLFKPGGPFKLSDRLCLFKQMIRGIDYLHSHGIAHRDIKLENLLLTTEGQLKITDFGVSEVFSGEHPGLRASGGECGKNMKEVRRCAPGICGSLPYMAPEVLEKEGDYDPRPLDVWSCAMVYLTMTYGGSPWQKAVTENAYFNDFMNGWNKFLASHPEGLITDGAGNTPLCGRIFNAERLGSPALKRLILKMLHPIPEKRIAIREVLTGPTVRGIECCSVESYGNNNCCVDAKASGKVATKKVLHNHVPPKEHKTPKLFQHRFDMGDGYS